MKVFGKQKSQISNMQKSVSKLVDLTEVRKNTITDFKNNVNKDSISLFDSYTKCLNCKKNTQVMTLCGYCNFFCCYHCLEENSIRFVSSMAFCSALCKKLGEKGG